MTMTHTATITSEISETLKPLVDRRSLLRLGLSESSVDHAWRQLELVRVTGDSKWYARKEDVLALLQQRERRM